MESKNEILPVRPLSHGRRWSRIMAGGAIWFPTAVVAPVLSYRVPALQNILLLYLLKYTRLETHIRDLCFGMLIRSHAAQ